MDLRELRAALKRAEVAMGDYGPLSVATAAGKPGDFDLYHHQAHLGRMCDDRVLEIAAKLIDEAAARAKRALRSG